MRRIRQFALALMLVLVASMLGISEAPSASASCVGPMIGVGGAFDDSDPPTDGGSLGRGQEFTVTGVWFRSGCADTFSSGPGCDAAGGQPVDLEAPLIGVELTLHRGKKTWLLDTQDASDTQHAYSVSWEATIPADAVAGPAELRAGTAALPITITR